MTGSDATAGLRPSPTPGSPTPTADRDVSAHEGGVGPVAYLVSSYPSLSHAFIENEVESLRAQGVEVHTFTVRPAPAETQLSPRSRAEAATTTTLLGSPARDWARAGLRTVRSNLPALVRTAATAARSGPATARSRTWQVFYLAEALLLFDTLRERGIRHVHVHFANNGADVARLVVALGLAAEGPDSGWRWTMTMHGPTEFEAVEAFDLPAKVRSAHAVACISDFCRGQLMRHSPPQEWDKLHLVRMAVDVEKFADAGAERLRRVGGGLRVLFVGRLVPEKGPSVLVAAVDLLRRRRPDIPLDVRIVGRGPLHDDLSRQITDQGLRDHVTLIGPVANDDLPALYAWSDVFCLPSFAEGVPVVLMEAMATGAPVVTTPIAGIPELVQDGTSGRLVPPGRADLLADALAALADAGTAERGRMGAAGREHVRSEFSPQLNAHRLLEVLSR